MTARAAVLAILAAAAASACGAPSMLKLPSGAGTPAPDASDALAQATASCRAVRTLTAEVAVSGLVAGRRIRGTLAAGVAAPASARLEAVAPFGAPLFIFVATGENATVLLPRDGRVLEHARPGAVLDAIAGVPLDAAELRIVMTGCASRPAASAGGRALGDDWRIVPDDAEGDVYLNRSRAAEPWRVVALVTHAVPGRAGWRADFTDFAGGLPRRITVASAGDVPRSASFALQLAMSQVDTNVALGDEAFRVRVPADAVPISLDELRASGPLADARRGARDGR